MSPNTSAATAETSIPREGMVATVRNRRGVVSSVQPFDDPGEGRLHLVDVEYNDGEMPFQEALLWEREPGTRLLSADALPRVEDGNPMPWEDYLAVARACRWSARLPYVDPDGSGPLQRLPVSSPFHGAIQVEDYQLVPLLKALRMPRVSLLLADDVGLGKTVEAGLILQELLLRRRIRRVLVLTPASLRVQWRDELDEKFALPFEIVDRDSTIQLRRQVGMDANPWRSFDRIIASYHYLKQPDILEELRSATRDQTRDGARLPWDLLIVDEAHNLTPVPLGEESDLCKMLRQVAPLFEHRLFLTATPHNGHTRSFTGLLEMLDPVRFSQTDELRAAERGRIFDVLVRRLKREINQRAEEAGSPSPFCNREKPEALLLRLSPAERRLAATFDALRSKVRGLVAAAPKRQRLAGNFAIEILGKRLLSGPVTFADSWLRCRQGLGLEEAARDGSDADLLAAKKAVDEETADDREAESRARAASSAVGAWLKPMASELEEEIEAIDQALVDLGLGPGTAEPVEVDPVADARWNALGQLLETRLLDRSSPGTDPEWRDDERLVVFTEYKTTLDSLVRRLRAAHGDERILMLYGGMADDERESIKASFNDPDDPVRILVATDAASEGLNLQETARYLLHWDVPWNPARLEQRNGRLDRHGQARDVSVWHFASDDDLDLRFLSRIVQKVHTIREDLGATGDVFDEITHRRLVAGEDADVCEQELDARVEASRGLTSVPRDASTSPRQLEIRDGSGAPDGEVREAPAAYGTRDDTLAASFDLDALAAEIDLDPTALRETLDSALAIGVGRPRIEPPDAEGRCRLVRPLPARWEELLEETLRRQERRRVKGAFRALAFDPDDLLVPAGPRTVFRGRPDTVLVHLAHPLVRRGLLSLARRRFEGSAETVSRWTVRRGSVPAGAEALVLLTVEELAVNELREAFHHWIRTLAIPVAGGELLEALPHRPARDLHPAGPPAPADEEDADLAMDLWGDVTHQLRDLLSLRRQRLSADLRLQVQEDRERFHAEERERYQARQGEVSHLIESSTLARLEREIAELQTRRAQGLLPSHAAEVDAQGRDLQAREEELARRRRHYEEVRKALALERKRVLEEIIPRRFALRGEAQILPVAVEIVLPEARP